MFFISKKSIFSLILSILLIILNIVMLPVVAADANVTESNTYVLDRDGNGEHLYRYQSPCMLGYDINGKYGGNGVPIQAFVFTMYNSVTKEHFPTYCSDINITAVQGADYRRLNLEDSSFSGSTAGQVRAILQKGFYLLPIEGESDSDHAARVAAKTAELAKASGADGLTTGEAIAATQAAIWRMVHGSSISFPKFCRYVFNPTQTKYASLCSYNELRYKNNTLINSTIETAYDYLISLEPVAATERSVSPSSFDELHDPVQTKNADGTYDVSVTTTIDVDMVSGDNLTVKAELNEKYAVTKELSNGKQTLTLTIENVPESVAFDDMTLSISGYQTAEGYFFFDASGDRSASQGMVGYNNSRLPVYAEVKATEERILKIQKSTKVATGDDTYVNKPLSNIVFDIFPVATMDEYTSGAVTLPDASEYKYPSLAEYTVITNDKGEASLNFVHQGMPDGIYLVVEQPHPSIVAPIEPFYLFMPMEDPATGVLTYEVTIKPKNDVIGNVYIEKDVILVGNDESTRNVYEPHTWIIGTNIPADISTGKSYTITDTLDNRLDFLGNVRVFLEKNDGSVAPVELIADIDYKLTVTDVDSLSEGNPSDSFKIELTISGMNKLANIIGSNNYNGYILRTYFDAQINANAEMGEEIPNRAELKYVNEVNFEFNEKSDKPHVSTGGINLLKVDAEEQTKVLQGAVFEVYRLATQEEIDADDNRIEKIPGVKSKVIKVSFFDNKDLQGEKVTSAVSNSDGNVTIYGLAYGEYFILETKAPEGYKLIAKALEITIDKSSHTEEKTLTILNYTGATLPFIGGIGTSTFIIIGVSVMGLACLLLIVKKFIEIRT